MDLARRIGHNLRKMRGSLTQEAFSVKVQLAQNSLSQWENGHRLRYFEDLASKLKSAGYDPYALLEPIEEGEPPYEPGPGAKEGYEPVVMRIAEAAARMPAHAQKALADLLEAVVPRATDQAEATLLKMLADVDPEYKEAVLSAVATIVRGTREEHRG